MINIDQAKFQIKKLYPKFVHYGYRHLVSKKGNELYLIRGKIGDKTIRFAYGDEFPTVTKIGSAQRRRLGAQYSKKRLFKSKKTKTKCKTPTKSA